MLPETPFDRVVVVVDRTRREFTLKQFLELPLAERIQYILGRQVDFYRDGFLVDRSLALRELRALQVTAATPAKLG